MYCEFLSDTGFMRRDSFDLNITSFLVCSFMTSPVAGLRALIEMSKASADTASYPAWSPVSMPCLLFVILYKPIQHCDVFFL